jgi:protein-tyrosine-phosphatase
MITYDEAGVILDDLIEELPDGIYDKLNGGVNLIEDSKKDDMGDYIMGLYHADGMGRYIEIFYGSFLDLYGDLDQDAFTDELRKTLHHELTHHVESLAGDRTLEKWDEQQAEKRKYGSIQADSILFVDDDGTALAPMACAMFRKFAEGKCGNVTVDAACIDDYPGKFSEDAVAAAGEFDVLMGADAAPLPARDTVLKDYDVVLCMTMPQANELYQRLPQFDEKIMCLGETDIKKPMFRHGWKKTAARVKEEIDYLIGELCEEDG